MKSDDMDFAFQESSGLINIMGDICRRCGGKSMVTVDPKDGLKEIEKNSNLYYELFFTHDGQIESKNVVVLAEDEKNALIYKNNFTSEEIEELVQYLKNEKIRIENYSLQGKMLGFSLRAFKQEGNDKIGMVKVSVILSNESGATVFHSTRVLRASKEMVSLSLPLPAEHSGNFQLRILAIDLIANRLASWESEIKL
jgi:hypothetical protein